MPDRVNAEPLGCDDFPFKIVVDHPGLAWADPERFHCMNIGPLLGLAEAVLGKAKDVVGWDWIDLYRWKTGNSSRLTMTGALREVMQRRSAARGNSTYVFPGSGDGDEDAPRSWSTGAIGSAIERAGCNSNPAQVKRDGHATRHAFRDTFASWLVQHGVSLFRCSSSSGIRARR